ncbi:MAG: RloB family protein [Bacteroidales bacterium]|nr:RloB family protein [Bacteroidales bacterium]
MAKPIFSFVVDGECEYWYLQMLKDNEPLLKIHLSPEIYKRKALKEQYKRVLELAKGSEKVFWVIDFDVIHKETRDAKKGKKTPLQEFEEFYNRCKKNDKIKVIVNNPCFEFWILLHFGYTTCFYENYKALLPDLKIHLADYEKTQKYFVRTNPDIYKRLKPNLQTAISHSEKLGEFDFKNKTTGIAEMHKLFKIESIDNFLKTCP